MRFELFYPKSFSHILADFIFVSYIHWRNRPKNQITIGILGFGLDIQF